MKVKTILTKALKETKILNFVVFTVPFFCLKHIGIRMDRYLYVAFPGGNVAFWDQLHLIDQV